MDLQKINNDLTYFLQAFGKRILVFKADQVLTNYVEKFKFIHLI